MKKHTQPTSARSRALQYGSRRESNAYEMRHRNKEIVAIYYELLKTAPCGSSIREMSRRVADSPIASGWISPENAARIIREEMAGKRSRHTAARRRLAQWLVERYDEYLQAATEQGCLVTPTSFARDVLPHLSLPESFMEPRTIESIIRKTMYNA